MLSVQNPNAQSVCISNWNKLYTFKIPRTRSIEASTKTILFIGLTATKYNRHDPCQLLLISLMISK